MEGKYRKPCAVLVPPHPKVLGRGRRASFWLVERRQDAGWYLVL